MPHPLSCIRRSLGILVFLLASPAAHALDAAAYQQAERVHDTRLRSVLRNTSVHPVWLADGRFWYERQDASGRSEPVLVDPARAARQVLFDADQLRAAITALVAAPQQLRTLDVQPDGPGLRLRLGDGRQTVMCLWPQRRCHPDTLPATPADALPSPDGTAWVQVHGHDLWLHRVDAPAQPLSRGGSEGNGYGTLPDFALRGLPRRAGRLPLPPFATWWAPQGTVLFGVRYDERALRDYPYLESAPATGARPIVHTVKLGLLGDREQVRQAWFVLDARSGQQRDIAVPDGWHVLTEAGPLGWDNGKVYTAIVSATPPARLRLVEIDLHSGGLRTVLEERSDTRVQLNLYTYNRPAVAVLPGQDTLVWFSQRDGWGHLYRVRLSDGAVLGQITRGDWAVRDLVGVDPATGLLYFTAGGVEGGDPYVRGLYQVALAGGPVRRLGQDTGDHAVDAGTGPLFGARPPRALAPDGHSLIDTVSRLDQAPLTVLRSTQDGRQLLELEQTDPTPALSAGWRPPRRERLLAADGHTPIHATVFFPKDYRDDGRFPIIDAMYGGVFTHNAPVSFTEAVSAQNPVSRASLAALGFVVVTIDGRGTAGRDKAFHDSSFLQGADLQLDDHVAAIGQLAQRYPGIDLQRVGIYGHSFGGYSAARALLRHPDFYRVAVASAGSHNFQGIYGGAVHGMDRLIGGVVPAAAMAGGVPAPFDRLDNTALAEHLRGHLLLAYGDLDENAPPAQTLQLAAALNRANRDYDLLYLAGQDHELFRNDAYFTRRMWDYFVRHLAGGDPPDYRLAPFPGGPG
ncbi:prolyl oligopeptidase family serine peptidase [Stenotrophomonas sp. 24(2023)]|uniref:S9 family peptidase n=1 Tax=Stenotrophomonas sp. 24(2023) TaxID=3068324 RepID=UPI0027E1470E|nr:prolyl oligopeptidase family serine peptidase [Stenotrophomonas sp. 24(2023)]WMJ71373.1 prolyl oligopeptidase family serine peptidase [Stenotrophomonas sp. 24(2023)]